MKIGLCIGHSRKINGHRDGGAVSIGKVAEWDYNLDLAKLVADRLDPKFGVVIISDYQGEGYTTAQRWLAGHLKDLKVDVAIEMHFNDSDSASAHGSEFLYWNSSTKGKALADSFAAALKKHVPELTSRGNKALTNADRGAEFCKLPSCPSVIMEPGFGSNTNDWKTLTEKKAQLADAYAEGLTKYFESL